MFIGRLVAYCDSLARKLPALLMAALSLLRRQIHYNAHPSRINGSWALRIPMRKGPRIIGAPATPAQ
jgi:hypothetical protein